MPLLDLAIPNFLAGVSQQPPAGRQIGQVEACDNAILHVVNGLAKRAGTRHLARLFTGDESVRLVHWVNRDIEERYVVLAGERRVRVFEADTGAEFAVKVNGTSTNAGRGKAGSGTPINYLDPRVQRGIVDQDEDFVIGAGDWLSTSGAAVTTYVSGRGPFKFGRRQSTSSVTADTVAEVGNNGSGTIGDIYQDFGTYSNLNAFSVFVKKAGNAINDIELAFIRPAGGEVYGWRFDISAGGVVTSGGAQVSGGGIAGYVRALVESYDDAWYRCTIQFSRTFEDALLPIAGTTRRIRIRFHTNAATPASKTALLFGARVYDYVETDEDLGNQPPLQPVPPYVHERSDLFRALTIADSTLILNTEITAALTADQVADNIQTGIIYVRNTNGAITNATYNIIITHDAGSFSTTYTQAAAQGRTSDDIAEGIRALIDADANLTATRRGSVVRIAPTAGATEIRVVEVTDAQGDENLVGFVDTIDLFTDLPLACDDVGGPPIKGHTVKVTGNTSDAFDDYYVEFTRDTHAQSTGGLRAGTWRESLLRPRLTSANGEAYKLDGGTLPLSLQRRQDDAAGTITGVPNSIYFDVSATAWDDRLVGELATSNPAPGFVGHTINDLFLYRGRLGFLSADKVILSEAAEIFNFWRTTVRSLPDTDPIELAHATSYDELRNAAPGGDQLIVSSQRRQFQLIGEPVLTPATAQLVPLRGFELLAAARPVDTGRGIIFARQDGTHAGLIEATVTQDDILARFEELTAQTPRYMAGDAAEIAHSSITHLTALRAGDPTILYMHQTFLDEEETRLQSAVHRWLFHADTLIRGVGYFESDLKQVVERAEGWFLEEQPTGTEILEPTTGLPLTHLDRRLTETQVTRVYAGGPDETTITLPYTIPAEADMRVVDAATGLIIPIVEETSTTLVVSGDITANAIYVGEVFTLRVRPTRPVIQEQSPRGGLTPRLSHPTDVRRLTLYLADTAFLRAEVSVDLRDPSAEEFSAAGLGTGQLGMGELTTFTGRTEFGIYGEASEIAVDLINATPFPSLIQAGRWEVLNTSRAPLA